MPDLLTEDLISLATAAKLFPGVRTHLHLNPSTLFRWCRRGARRPDGRRVTLEHIRAGSRVLTSREALSRFVAKLSATPPDDADRPRSPARSRLASERADGELAADGW